MAGESGVHAVFEMPDTIVVDLEITGDAEQETTARVPVVSAVPLAQSGDAEIADSQETTVSPSTTATVGPVPSADMEC